MSDKTEARLALEARAKELNVDFPANIGDAKLQERVTEAEAAALNTQPPAGTDGKPAAEDGQGQAAGAPAAPATKSKGKAKADSDAVTVICAVAGGRRRAGRRWDGGATTLPAADLTETMRAELDADPMFQIKDAAPAD